MNAKLTPEQYWEWRTTIAELETAKAKNKIVQLQLKIQNKDTEILAVRAQLFAVTIVEQSKLTLEAAQAEYDRYKKVLEDSLGMSLSNKMIDEITLEVKDLPSENQQQSAKAEGDLKNGSGKTS